MAAILPLLPPRVPTGYLVAALTSLETAIVMQSAGGSLLAFNAPLLSAQFLTDCTPTAPPVGNLTMFEGNYGGCVGGLPMWVSGPVRAGILMISVSNEIAWEAFVISWSHGSE